MSEELEVTQEEDEQWELLTRKQNGQADATTTNRQATVLGAALAAQTEQQARAAVA